MNKNRVAKWQKRIEDTFAGKGGLVGGDHLQDLIQHEMGMSHYLIGKFSGHVRLMDAFLDFYIETLQKAAGRQETKLPDEAFVTTLVHLVTLWRFRASYIAFWNGYAIDATSLLRAVLENVLQIAAVRLRIISFKDILGPPRADTKGLSTSGVDKLIREHYKACDSTARCRIMGQESGLSASTVKDLKLFVETLHMCVHKSQINFICGYRKLVVEQQPLPLFPTYDESLVTLCTNPSMFLGWMVTRTLPLLQIKDGEFPGSWHRKYKVLDQSFEEAVASFPKRLGRSVEELIHKKFQFEGIKDSSEK